MKSLVSFFRANLAYTVMFALALLLVVPSTVSYAADPTDAAGLISAVTAVFTAFPILTIVVTAGAIVGIALFMIRRGKTAAR